MQHSANESLSIHLYPPTSHMPALIACMRQRPLRQNCPHVLTSSRDDGVATRRDNACRMQRHLQERGKKGHHDCGACRVHLMRPMLVDLAPVWEDLPLGMI